MKATPIKRVYSNFRGVDFSNEPSIVDLRRSPDAINVWKNYGATQGRCVETRPGYRMLNQFINKKINGLYFLTNSILIIHAGTYLYYWKNFPDTSAGNISFTFIGMNNVKSSFVKFDEKVYMLDGKNYTVIKEGNNGNISTIKYPFNTYIPTTTIARHPNGGGEMYEDVNLLSKYRINTFLGDGTSTEYYLDAQLIDSVEEVKVNGSVVNDYTVNITAGKIIFTTAPSEAINGVDNVYIKFAKTVEGYADRILKCTKMVVFDNRVFFTGNSNFKNTIFHSSLNDPTYVSDLDYYQDGTDESAIKDMVVGNNILWVFKEPNQQNETIFYHTPMEVSEYGKVYPVQQGNVSTGCYSCAINYSDDIVFLSKYGLEGITGDIAQEQALTHRSSLIDSKLINSGNYEVASMTEWQGYLLILSDNKIYLGDMRQLYQGVTGYEYEWYYWDFNQNITLLKEYKGKLYIGTEDGSFFVVEGTNDNGEPIYSCWTTPMDNFGFENHLKTTNKRGGIAKIKTIQNGKIKIAESTNKRDERFITSKSSNGFDYSNIDYSNFAYTTKNDSYIVYKIKDKKFIDLSLKFYSDELNKPFGLYEATMEVFVGGYVKR